MAIPKQINSITEADLEALVQVRVREGFTLEYKRGLTLKTEEAKAEFLKDVTALANTHGGDLLIGIRDESGEAAEIVGWDDYVKDRTIGQISQIILSNIEPQVSPTIHPIPLAN